MKVLIFYASYGGGHLGAARSIEDSLKSQHPEFDVELIDCMKYVNFTIEKITSATYRELAKKAPWAWGRIYHDSQKGPLAHLTSRSNKIMAIKLLRLLREKQPDMIISTHPFGSQMCSYLKRKGKISAKIATVMTDFAPHDQWLVGSDFMDYLFVAHENMKQDIGKKGVPLTKIHATGIPISSRFLADYPRDEIKKEFALTDKKTTVLFFGGGEFGLGKTRTFSVFEALIREIDSIQVIAIAGKNEKMKEKFQELVHTYHKEDSVVVLGFTHQVPELMSVSDVVVSKPGGMTTSESLACCLPMIIINPIPGQEEENAEFLENSGVGIWIRKQDDPVTIFRDFFEHPECLAKMKKNTELLSKKFASQTITHILFD
jgi:processive 1,2-diacylglycerol beta-glucosyltransferase